MTATAEKALKTSEMAGIFRNISMRGIFFAHSFFLNPGIAEPKASEAKLRS
jgi:hypothetical protein